MPDYDFRSLSTYDFELLVRDLLQQELHVRLESFAKGRDRGIDFRFKSHDQSLVVQCKHYPTDYESLLRVLKRSEKPKVEKLKPARYILAASTPLTPDRKDAILALLAPYCRGTEDLLGREDLNNLIGLHPQVEQGHFKLWLTSEAVLTRVLNAGVWGDTELTLQRIRQRARRYVPNPSLGRARQVLEKYHCCVIAGIPGIGKTTLAEILLVDHVDRHDFQAIRIANDLSEIKAVKDPQRRQFFYFDDFLGKTGLDKLQKNEDQRLTEFMEEVASNRNWRFVLTTREYILNAARMRYEALVHSDVDLAQCIVDLSDYTQPIRARILYNHIYFSDIPNAYKRTLLQDRSYERILNHPNYNPRIIDHMTQYVRVSHISSTEFLKEFLHNLSNPVQVWDHAFRHQLSEAARHVLQVLGSLPDEVLVGDLETAFNKFYQYRRQKLGFSTSSSDFRNALKELEGNFIRISLVGTDQIATFHNPSVQDFLESYLDASPGEVADLIEGAYFFDQFVQLWRGRQGTRFKGVETHGARFVRKLEEQFSAPRCVIHRLGDGKGNIIGMRRADMSFEARTIFANELSNAPAMPGSKALGEHLLTTVIARIKAGEADRKGLVQLLRTPQVASDPDAPILGAAKEYLARDLEDFDDFDSLGKFVKAFPSALDSSTLESVGSQFLAFCEGYADGWGDDPDVLRLIAEDIERVGEQLGADVEEFSQELKRQARHIESEQAADDYEQDRDDDDDRRLSDVSEGIDSMFDGLLSEIDERE